MSRKWYHNKVYYNNKVFFRVERNKLEQRKYYAKNSTLNKGTVDRAFIMYTAYVNNLPEHRTGEHIKIIFLIIIVQCWFIIKTFQMILVS